MMNSEDLAKVIEPHLRKVSNRINMGVGLYKIMTAEEQAYFIRKERFHTLLETERFNAK